MHLRLSEESSEVQERFVDLALQSLVPADVKQNPDLVSGTPVLLKCD